LIRSIELIPITLPQIASSQERAKAGNLTVLSSRRKARPFLLTEAEQSQHAVNEGALLRCVTASFIESQSAAQLCDAVVNGASTHLISVFVIVPQTMLD
jgi:hypothetical protein